MVIKQLHRLGRVLMVLTTDYLFYSTGVATFCRTKSAFSSTEVALPVKAEEGFTGLVQSFCGNGSNASKVSDVKEGLEEFGQDELLKIDSEGRCIVTDHGHFGELM